MLGRDRQPTVVAHDGVELIGVGHRRREVERIQAAQDQGIHAGGPGADIGVERHEGKRVDNGFDRCNGRIRNLPCRPNRLDA